MRREGATATERRPDPEAGAVLVEFALVFPILAMMLLGMVSAGIAYNRDIQMTHATREGARFGATIPQGQTFTSGTWATNVRDLVVARSADEFDSADVCVALVTGDSPTVFSTSTRPATNYTTNADGTPCYDDSGNGETGLRVQVSASGDSTIDTGFVSIPVAMGASATAKHETPPA